MNDRKRVAISLAIVLIGACFAIYAGINAPGESTEQASGTVIDFGDRNTVWTETDISDFDSCLDLLEFATEENGYSLTLSDGKISELNDIVSDDNGSWDLWVVYPGDTEWVRLDAPYDQDPTEFTITSWAYCGADDKPTVAVDFVGNPIYGFQQKHRVVSMSPTITEILGSVKAQNIIVGCDAYSDHPKFIVDGKNKGNIAVTGTFTGPSFELITNTNPDIVIGDGGQRSHVQTAKMLRSSGIDSIIIYPGEDLDSVLDNIFIVGKVIRYEDAAKAVISNTEEVLDSLYDLLYTSSSEGIPRAMVSLSDDMSPWVSGNGTYIGFMVDDLMGKNVFADWTGWAHISSERIGPSDPEKIIIITLEYKATQAEYDHMIANLPAQWKMTSAYATGDIYLFCEDAAELMQRYGPRSAQVAELVTMVLHPELFDKTLPKYIGNDYADHLTYSSELSYN